MQGRGVGEVEKFQDLDGKFRLKLANLRMLYFFMEGDAYSMRLYSAVKWHLFYLAF